MYIYYISCRTRAERLNNMTLFKGKIATILFEFCLSAKFEGGWVVNRDGFENKFEPLPASAVSSGFPLEIWRTHSPFWL